MSITVMAAGRMADAGAIFTRRLPPAQPQPSRPVSSALQTGLARVMGPRRGTGLADKATSKLARPPGTLGTAG